MQHETFPDFPESFSGPESAQPQSFELSEVLESSDLSETSESPETDPLPAAAEPSPEPDIVVVRIVSPENQRLANLRGPLDSHLRQLERGLGVEINGQGAEFQIVGPADSAQVAGRILQALYDTTRDEALTPNRVHLFLQQATREDMLENKDTETIVRVRRGLVKGRGANQCGYLEKIRSFDVNFAIGPAGTGKTYLAVACAVAAFESEQVRRILLVRPAVEAGERLGFLPGDLAQKIDPYLRPLYDSLYEMMGFDRVTKLMERSIIEVAPLAYMRGRTLNESFIILDEAQNTTVEQMKMFLTRIGFGSTMVITGDITQIDLPRGQQSGLRHAVEVLKDVKGLSFTFFQSKDVVRHALVARIFDAYEQYENSNPAAP
uniref:PhoH-like protein n=1 Tax=Candidatus Kentrum sp. FM TaxID=2126340 RepID=A0A450S920_9GAMM|nr:MAG: phosphate starvation-inducible protein PhoH [Candidatus Kentron sp. FM]VFJ49052.1 MAG: phosphate starvation-inducible protein PhoH [Candidatus Kentron sp. FM]VFK08020.1 MAG: phosphate starvation-inducible protein PhoH [Candidatus Kentron sp. FM]